MTKAKTILGISLAATFAISMIFAQGAIASGSDKHLKIKNIEFDVFEDLAKVELQTQGNIPVGQGAFGYGVITTISENGPENVLALTTHVCAADSFVQGDIVDEINNCPFAPEGSIGVLEFLRDNVAAPFPGGEIDQANDGPLMHPHILDLTGYSDDCSDAIEEAGLDPGDAAVEVDVLRTLGLDPVGTANNISPGDYEVNVDGKELTVGNIPIDENNLLDDEMAAYASFNIYPLHDGNSHITNLCLYDLTLTPAN